MEVQIVSFSGEKFSLVVGLETTVGELKQKIRQRCNLPLHNDLKLSAENGQRIVLDQDSRTLVSHGLQHGSQVMVLITQAQPFQVFLKNDKGQVHTYDVTREETVSSFKQKVFNKERVPLSQQRLIYNGRQMEDGGTLSQYNVGPESTIFLELRLRGG
ncbi:polyubiquitin-like [Denticeps clupeoides]|uniref:polyubiquitin-like n=1 Tax=Denticeps clupeoides TaxID=299321 RepID=UPI0010A437CE|nr:polyubiquitin-like [Denticeps clupeoides]